MSRLNQKSHSLAHLFSNAHNNSSETTRSCEDYEPRVTFDWEELHVVEVGRVINALEQC